MYNGVGITTPRASGSNGNVQKNLSSITYKSKHKNDSRKPKSLDVIITGKQNEDIIEHDKKRKIELKCLEFQQRLEDRGYSESEVFERVSSYRKSILELMLTENKHGQIVTKELEEITEVQQHKNEKLRQAFGISDTFVDGSSFYPESRIKETVEVKNSSHIFSSPSSKAEADVISMPSRKRSRKSSLSPIETKKKKKKKKKKHKRKHVSLEDKSKTKNHAGRLEKYSSPDEVESAKQSKYSHCRETSELVKKHRHNRKKSSSKHKSSSKDRRISIKDKTKTIDHRTRSRDNTPAKDIAIRNKKSSSLDSPQPEKRSYDKHSKIRTPVVKKWKSKKRSKKRSQSRGRSSSSNCCSEIIQKGTQESNSQHRSETPPVVLKSRNQSDDNSNSRNFTSTRLLSKIKHSPFRRSMSVELNDGSDLTRDQKSQSPVFIPDEHHILENETNLGEYSSVFTKLTLCRDTSAAEKYNSSSSCRRTAFSSLHLSTANLEQEEIYPSSYKSNILRHNSNTEKHSDESSPLKYSPVDRSPDRYTDILIDEHTKKTNIESVQKTTFTKLFDATKSPVATQVPQPIEQLQDETTNTLNKGNSQMVSDTDSLEDFASVMIDEAVKKTATALQVNREKTLESLKKLLTSIETNEEKRKKYISSSRSASRSKKEKKSNSRSRWFSDSSRSSRSRRSSLSSTGRSTNSRATSDSDRNSKRSSRSFSRIVLNKRKRDSRSESSSVTRRSPRSVSYDSYDSGRFVLSRSRSGSDCKKKKKRHLCHRGRASGSDSTSTRSSSSSPSKSRSRSLSIPRRKGSPSFLERRRITSARKRPVPYQRSSVLRSPSRQTRKSSHSSSSSSSLRSYKSVSQHRCSSRYSVSSSSSP